METSRKIPSVTNSSSMPLRKTKFSNLDVVKRLAAPNPKKTSEPDIKYATVTQWERWKTKKIKDSIVRQTRLETANFRNSYLHNMCIDLLIEGFHKTFEEIFELVEHRRKARLKGGVDSVLWKKPLLSAEYGKLNVLKRHLTTAESAALKGDWETVYSCQHVLAVHFLNINDMWLSDYFFKSALDTSFKIRLDGRMREAEALYYMALVRERHSDIESASNFMDACYDLSVGRAWTNDENELLELACCNRMSGLFTTLAEQSSEPKDALPYYKRALDAAKDSENKVEIAKAALRLGICYHELLDNELASQYLKESFDAAETLNVDSLFGSACRAMALSCYQQGYLDRCLNILRPYVRKFWSSSNRSEFARAATCLGTVLNITGSFATASESLTAAYYETEVLGRDEVAAVRMGVANGNLMLNSFMDNLELNPSVMLPNIGSWKDNRGPAFNIPRSEDLDLKKSIQHSMELLGDYTPDSEQTADTLISKSLQNLE